MLGQTQYEEGLGNLSFEETIAVNISEDIGVQKMIAP